jgi:hypothetical protein
MDKIVLLALLVNKTALTVPFTVINAVFWLFLRFSLKKISVQNAERSIFIKNALILCYATVRAHITFLC